METKQWAQCNGTTSDSTTKYTHSKNAEFVRNTLTEYLYGLEMHTMVDFSRKGSYFLNLIDDDREREESPSARCGLRSDFFQSTDVKITKYNFTYLFYIKLFCYNVLSCLKLTILFLVKPYYKP